MGWKSGLVSLVATPLLASCASTGTLNTAGTECSAANGQAFMGRVASAATGAELLKVSGAKSLRWAPPDSMMTMDYVPDRLTVTYDRQMIITDLVCG